MMAKRFAALLLAVCLTLTCALGALAEGPTDSQIPEASAESDTQAEEALTDSEEPSGEDIPAPTMNSAGSTGEELVDRTAGTPDGNENQEDMFSEDEPDELLEEDDAAGDDTAAPENASAPQGTAKTAADDADQKLEEALADIAEMDPKLCERLGGLTIKISPARDVYCVGEKIKFVLSFKDLSGKTENESIYNYLRSMIQDQITNKEDYFGPITMENWYKDEDLVLHSDNMGIRKFDDKGALKDLNYDGDFDGENDGWAAFSCIPVQSGSYKLDVQTTLIMTGGHQIANVDKLQKAGMPFASIEFSVVDPAEVDIGAEAGEGVAEDSKEAAKAAIGEALASEIDSGSTLSNDIRKAVQAGEDITAELTVSEEKDPEEALFTSRFADKLSYKDISIAVMAGGRELGKLPQLATSIPFALDFPSDAGPIIACVLREHDGVVEELPFHVENDKVCFSSDKFSTYAIGSTDDIAYADVTPIAPQTYTGDPIEPEFTVSINGGQVLDPDTDYTVVGYENNVESGTATITIEGQGTYKGQKKISFTIVKPVVADGDDGGTAPAKPAKADEYIVCKACGHQTWEPYLDGWRCTNCGHLRGTTGVPAGTAAAAAKAAPAAYHGTIPQTADEFPLAGVAAVFGVSLAGLGALLLLRKRQR